jgi:hypothetical protein
MFSGQDQFIREFLGSEYAPVYFPGVPRLGQAQAVSVGAGAEVQVDFAMRPVKTVGISGRVIGPDGTSASDVSINLEEAETEDYSSQRYTFTDAKGNFSLKSIPPGSTRSLLTNAYKVRRLTARDKSWRSVMTISTP